jgi:hypothetical protein
VAAAGCGIGRVSRVVVNGCGGRTAGPAIAPLIGPAPNSRFGATPPLRSLSGLGAATGRTAGCGVGSGAGAGSGATGPGPAALGRAPMRNGAWGMRGQAEARWKGLLSSSAGGGTVVISQEHVG